MSTWTPSDMPDLTGKKAIVTGANSGIGLPTALELARHGAEVVLACRDAAKGQAAAERIRRAVPGAGVSFAQLDLAELASVRRFAGTVDRLDLLVNNGGVLAMSRKETKDGFELMFGTNHLGHFALTGLLLPLLLSSPGARVVTVSSDAHESGKLDFDDLGQERGFKKMASYGTSKLANLLFALELQRRADRAGADLVSAASHPGMVATQIFKVGPLLPLIRLIMRSAEVGAVPSLYAATSPEIRGGEFVGPKTKLLTPSQAGRSAELAERLWEVSTQLTAVGFKELAYS